MGASNALRAYQLYSRLDDRPLRVLAYMGLVARDGDAEPWFGLGHEAIAELALGLDVTGDPVKDAAALRVVRRAITALRRAGAITVIKRPTNLGGHAIYRLWLTAPSPDAQRPTTVDEPPRNPVDNPPSPVTERPTTSPVVGHSVVSRRSLSDRVVGHSATYPIERNQRGTNKERRTNGDLDTANCGKHARSPPQSLPAQIDRSEAFPPGQPTGRHHRLNEEAQP